jgi:hypothetical protein
MIEVEDEPRSRRTQFVKRNVGRQSKLSILYS